MCNFQASVRAAWIVRAVPAPWEQRERGEELCEFNSRILCGVLAPEPSEPGAGSGDSPVRHREGGFATAAGFQEGFAVGILPPAAAVPMWSPNPLLPPGPGTFSPMASPGGFPPVSSQGWDQVWVWVSCVPWTLSQLTVSCQHSSSLIPSARPGAGEKPPFHPWPSWMGLGATQFLVVGIPAMAQGVDEVMFEVSSSSKFQDSVIP